MYSLLFWFLFNLKQILFCSQMQVILLFIVLYGKSTICVLTIIYQIKKQIRLNPLLKNDLMQTFCHIFLCNKNKIQMLLHLESQTCCDTALNAQIRLAPIKSSLVCKSLACIWLDAKLHKSLVQQYSLYIYFFLLINKMKMISNENHMILIAA